jgi:hypothetical protein
MAEPRNASSGAVAAFGMLMTVAVVAVLVSNRARTMSIIGAIGDPKSGLPFVLGAALSLVTGGNYGPPNAAQAS